MSDPTLRDIVKAECDSFPIPPRLTISIEAVKHARSRLGLDLKQAVDFVRAPAGHAPIDFVAERARLLEVNAQLLEALKRVDHTLSVHGRVDAETPLHEFVSDVIFAAEGAQS